MEGFVTTFTCPFHRKDVWKEITARRPLGVTDATVVIMQVEGEDTSLPVSKGTQRLIRFPQTEGCAPAETVSRVSEFVPGERITWDIVSQSEAVEFVMYVRGGLPQTQISLRDVPVGTSVELRYMFDSIRWRDSSTWRDGCSRWIDEMQRHDAVDELQARFDGVHELWFDDMVRRNYTPLTPLPVGLGGGFQVAFRLPFKRADIFKELCHPTSPLGSELTCTKYVIEGGGLEQAAAEAGALQIGVKRRVIFKSEGSSNNEVVSELVALEENVFIRWQQLSSNNDVVNMLGEGDSLPEVSMHSPTRPQTA